MKWLCVFAGLLLTTPILAGLLSGASAMPVDAGAQSGEARESSASAENPQWFKNSFLDIREDIAEAAAEKRRVILYFFQDGCPYCGKLLRDNYGNREIAEYSRQHFDTIAINMWGDREVVGLLGKEVTEKQFAEDLQVMFTPTMCLLDEAGKVALRINGYYHPAKFLSALKYVAERQDAVMAFRDFYGQQPQKKASGKLHVEEHYLQPPYDLRTAQRGTGKPLLVMFEQKQCLVCDELHNDILKRESSLKETRKFDIALLDMWSTVKITVPDGRQLAIRQWAKELNIQNGPSMVFFDSSGEEVFRTEAYLRAFHTQSVMDYVSSGGYKEQPSFQRWLGGRVDRLEEQGVHVDIWE